MLVAVIASAAFVMLGASLVSLGSREYVAVSRPVTSYHKVTSFKILNVKLDEQLKPFEPVVTDKEVRICQEIFANFSKAMTEASLTFFIYGGSLLGSWRHHNLVPWDDDLDVGVPLSQNETMATVLNRLAPNYVLDVRQKKRWKFYSAQSIPISRVTWRWPFLDINFYEGNSTHIWDHDRNYRPFFIPKEEVFPLYKRPFMDMMLPAPRSPEAVLKHFYKMDYCAVGWYDHHDEKMNHNAKSVRCEDLQHVFPFVQRQPAGGGHVGCNESLVFKGNVLAWVVLNTTQC